MNRFLSRPLLALSLAPLLAFAQNTQDPKSPDSAGIGLDLTQDTQAPPPGEAAPAPPDPGPPPAAEAEAAAPPEVRTALDITGEDRVKSVQRKVYLKKGRFEVAPFVTVSINDPYYTKTGGALRAAYYLSDTLSVAARGMLLQVVPTDDVSAAKRAFQSRIFFSEPQWGLMGDLEWSPLYGKVAFFNSILHFDGYLLAGAGVVSTVASGLPGRSPNVAADLGLGLRFVAKDYLAVNVALINTSYVDQPLNSSKGVTQNMLTLNAGISLFFPFRSTGRVSE